MIQYVLIDKGTECNFLKKHHRIKKRELTIFYSPEVDKSKGILHSVVISLKIKEWLFQRGRQATDGEPIGTYRTAFIEVGVRVGKTNTGSMDPKEPTT